MIKKSFCSERFPSKEAGHGGRVIIWIGREAYISKGIAQERKGELADSSNHMRTGVGE